MTKKVVSKGGRPEFQPTAAIRRQVAIAAGAGTSHEEIALGLGISRPTLNKHFQFELSTGANKKRLEVLTAMFSAAKKGNVAAQKAFLALTPKVAAPPLSKSDPAAKPLGKKEEANRAAESAHVGTSWGDLLTPPPTTVQ